MKIIKKIFTWLIALSAAIYIAISTYFYFYQESLIFPGVKTANNYSYNFPVKNTEYHIKTADGNTIDGYLFKTGQPSKGLIFYLHGNGNNVQEWRNAIANYTGMGYDAFAMDYPGYGKSTGNITSLNEFFSSVKTVYDTLKRIYPENKIIIMGYSIGTGPAAWLAANNRPGKLILLAPYYSMSDMALKRYPFLPVFIILKYQINTYEYLQHVKAPVTIFHGDADQVVYYSSSLKLKPYLKPGDTLITLKGQDHLHFDENPVFLQNIKKILQ